MTPMISVAETVCPENEGLNSAVAGTGERADFGHGTGVQTRSALHHMRELEHAPRLSIGFLNSNNTKQPSRRWMRGWAKV